MIKLVSKFIEHWEILLESRYIVSLTICFSGFKESHDFLSLDGSDSIIGQPLVRKGLPKKFPNMSTILLFSSLTIDKDLVKAWYDSICFG